MSSCGCSTSQTTTCSKTETPCVPAYACSCDTQKVISIQPIVPVSTCDETKNKYSIEVNIKPRNGKGSQTNKYVDFVTGTTQQELADNMLAIMVKIVNDIIRSVIGESYNGSDVTFVYGTHADTLITFQTYFKTGVLDGPADLTDAVQIAYVDYITQQVYESFRSIHEYIIGNAASLVICAGDAGKVYQLKITNCLFCYTLIYN